MNYLMFLPKEGDKPSGWVILIAVVIVLVMLFNVFTALRNAKKSAEADEYRVEETPICVWKFSEAEWKEYSKNFLNYENPKGSAEIRFTKFDIWITDGNGTLRQQLNAGSLALTDCRIEEKGIKIRIRSVKYPRHSPHYKVATFHFLIPEEKAADAVKIVAAWKKSVADNADVIAEVTPPDVLTGLFGENDF